MKDLNKKYSKQLDDYWERIEKAIEILTKCGLVDAENNFNAYLDTIELKELLDILEGEDKE